MNLRGHLHPSLKEAQKVCEAHFEKTLLDGMHILDTPEHWEKVLNLIADDGIKLRLANDWANPKKNLTSRDKWKDVEKEIEWSKVFY